MVRGPLSVVSCQLSVVSCQLSVVRGRFTAPYFDERCIRRDAPPATSGRDCCTHQKVLAHSRTRTEGLSLSFFAAVARTCTGSPHPKKTRPSIPRACFHDPRAKAREKIDAMLIA